MSAWNDFTVRFNDLVKNNFCTGKQPTETDT